MATCVSVLTPSFNQAQWLGANLASVSSQSHGNIEHVVVDDGSTDGSLDILERAPGHVKWESQPNRGQSNALDKALANSSGRSSAG
jgi:glycosyltransferase involved in cell wall biosynthesis